MLYECSLIAARTAQPKVQSKGALNAVQMQSECCQIRFNIKEFKQKAVKIPSNVLRLYLTQMSQVYQEYCQNISNAAESSIILSQPL